jgi:hypothetical protein
MILRGRTRLSTGLTLTVTAPNANGIANGSFETGNLSGWTASGLAAVSTASHSGTYSAVLGSTSPTNGDSTLSQTFTAPSNGGTLAL